jgi:hypothetical protein
MPHLGQEEFVQVGEVGVVLGAHLQRRNLRPGGSAGAARHSFRVRAKASLGRMGKAGLASASLSRCWSQVVAIQGGTLVGTSATLWGDSAGNTAALTSARHCSAMLRNTGCGKRRSRTCREAAQQSG